MKLINPDTLAKPKGYSNGVLCPPGRTLYVAGQIGWDAEGRFVSDRFAEQFRQALYNVVEVVRAAGGSPDQIAFMRIYVVDKQVYRRAVAEVGQAYRELMGRHYPAMALVQVADLLEDEAQVEIEAVAVLAD